MDVWIGGKLMGWISVKDKLPELNHENGLISAKVLIAQGVHDKQIAFGLYRIDKWVTPSMIPFVKQDLITHWMPLPELPK